MNLNLLSYLLFFPITTVIAVWVARTAHKNGEVWLMDIFGNDHRLVRAINDTLLIGCYVLNIGYIAIVLSTWMPVVTMDQMMATLTTRTALIVVTLAFLHYTNIGVLLLWARIHRRQHGQAPHVTAITPAPDQNT
jgi:hypothetical protein